MRTYLAKVYNANGTTTNAQIAAIAASRALEKALSWFPSARRIEVGWRGLAGLQVVKKWEAA